MPQRRRVVLDVDEGLDVRMVAAQGRHHRAAPRAGGEHGGAHRVPYAHERYRAGGNAAAGGSHRAGRPQGGKVVTDTAAVLHGERAFLQRLEDAGQVVGDFAHDEAVEQRHPVPGAGAGKNAAAGEEAKILQQMVEALRPPFRVLLLRRCDRLRHAPPAVADARLAGEAIACPPDVA
jgi:hypothetical protein